MSFTMVTALIAQAVATVSAIVLINNACTRRIRLLAFCLGLVSVCHATLLLQAKASTMGWDTQIVHLTVGVLSLASMHFLKRENVDRGESNLRLRLAEAAPKAHYRTRRMQAMVDQDYDEHRRSAQPGERREEPRFHVAAPARVKSLDGDGTWFEAHLADVAFRGFSVRTPTSFPRGTCLRLDIGQNILLGEVVHHRQEGPDHIHGLRLWHSLDGENMEKILEMWADVNRVSVVEEV